MKKLFCVNFANKQGGFLDYFEAETEQDAKEQAELYLYDEASDFAGKRGYKITLIEEV